MSGRGNVNVNITSSYDNSGAARAQRDMDKMTRQQQRAAAAEARVAAQRRAAVNTVATSLGALGLAMTAAAAGAVAMSARFDYAMSAIKATGVSSLGSLRKAALQAGRDTAYSAVEAANGIEQLAKAGVDADDILSGGLTATLSLAAAGELEVARAAEITAVTLKQFGLAGKDATRVADSLAAGAAKAVGGVEELSQGLEYVGPVAKSLGVSMEETVGTLAMFAEQGILGQKAGTGLRGVIMSLSAPTAAAKRAMDEYGISVYDASGKFVGLDGLAGQLNEKLAGLDDATRQAALGQMFGNAQITAANILYQEGAQSVTDWTDAVSEAGYAADVAATRLDNLQGDLQILRGSIETAMISLGESGQGPLRSLTQSLTGAVNQFAEMPAAAQGALLALAGGGGVLTLGAAGAMKLTTSLAEARIALQTLGWTAKGIATASGVGVALLALGAAYAAIAGNQQRARQATEEYTGTLEDQTGAITGTTRALVAKRLEERGALESAERIGVNARDLTDAILGEGDAYERLSAYLDGYRGNADQSADARERERAALHNVIIALDGESAALESAADAKRRMQDATEDSTTAHEKATAVVEEQMQAIEDLISAIDELNGVNQSREQAEIRWQDQLHETRTALAEATDTLDLSTEAGRANRQSLLDVAESAVALAKARRDQTGDEQEFIRTLEEARKVLYNQARQFFATDDAAWEYVDTLLSVPGNVSTDVAVHTAAAERALDYLLRPRVVDVGVRVSGSSLSTILKADGGIVESYAAGGIRESHIAQIAPAGAMRVWAEPETGGEAYIPLSPAKRARSIAVWEETGRRLGVGGDTGPIRLHPADIDALGEVILAGASRVSSGVLVGEMAGVTRSRRAMGWS